MTESDAFRILSRQHTCFELRVRRNVPLTEWPFVVTLAIRNSIYRTEARTVREGMHSVLQSAGIEAKWRSTPHSPYLGHDRRVP
jgi:hypothetical protein